MLNYIYKVLDNTNLVKREEGVWTGNSERKREISRNNSTKLVLWSSSLNLEITRLSLIKNSKTELQ